MKKKTKKSNAISRNVRAKHAKKKNSTAGHHAQGIHKAHAKPKKKSRTRFYHVELKGAGVWIRNRKYRSMAAARRRANKLHRLYPSKYIRVRG